MYEQQLPGYTTAFKDAPWGTRDSAHYRFHYFKNSLAEKEIEKIVEVQERAYQQIVAFLELPSVDGKISYYLYPDAETKEKLMGTPWFAQSIYNDFAVHTLYTEKDRVIGPHEDAHLLSLPLGLSIGFLQEGFAERMVGHDWYGNDFADVVKEAFTNERFVISPDLLTSHDAWIATNDDLARQYYALAALFSEYLLNNFGKERYLLLYKTLQRKSAPQENERAYQEILGINSQESWEQFLENIRGSSPIASNV